MNSPCSRRSGGFSLVEVLVVMAIIAIIAAVIFLAMAPARIKARYASCSQNLRQMYIANMAYGADHDGEDLYPELNGGAYSRNLYVMLSYGVVKNQLFCPSCPAGSFEGLATTYSFAPFGLHDVPLGMRRDGPTKRDRIIKEWQANGANYLYILCHVHDQLEYYSQNSDMQADPYLVAIRANGSHFAGFGKGIGRFFPLRGIPPMVSY